MLFYFLGPGPFACSTSILFSNSSRPFCIFPLGQGLTNLPGVLLLCSSPPSGSEVTGITGPMSPSLATVFGSQRTEHCSFVCMLSLRSQHQHTFIVSFFFLCFWYHTWLYFYIGTIYKVRCSREGRKYLTFVCHILLSASCRLNHEERNRDTDVQLL